MHLLKESGIATVPGIYFGSEGIAYKVKLCRMKDIEDLGLIFTTL